MTNKIIAVLVLLLALVMALSAYSIMSESTTVEKICATAQHYLADNPNMSLVQAGKLKEKYYYAIRHKEVINTDVYLKKNPHDIILEEGTPQDPSYLILSNHLPDPEFIKTWEWAKK